MALEGVQSSKTRSQIWSWWFERLRFDSIFLEAVNEDNTALQSLVLTLALSVIFVRSGRGR
jgi:hypothetical protein